MTTLIEQLNNLEINVLTDVQFQLFKVCFRKYEDDTFFACESTESRASMFKATADSAEGIIRAIEDKMKSCAISMIENDIEVAISGYKEMTF